MVKFIDEAKIYAKSGAGGRASEGSTAPAERLLQNVGNFSGWDSSMDDVQKRIDEIVKGHRVVLFMKGTAQFPMCGFSGRAIQVLKACGAEDLTTVNVLDDEAVRQGINMKPSPLVKIRQLLRMSK